MKYFICILFSIFSASFDKWIGNSIFFMFPIIIVYFQNLYIKDKYKNLYVFFYTLFYFSLKYDIGFYSILFFVLYLFIDTIFINFEKTFISTFIYSFIFTMFLGMLQFSYFSIFLTTLIVIILYFINMRMIIYENPKS